MTVRIEPYGRTHVPAFQALASDARIAATTLVPHPYPPDGAEQHARNAARWRETREAFAFAILADGAVVGSCGIKHLDWEAGQGEVGYWIGVPYWGRGYATAAVRRLTAVGFGELGLLRLVAEVLVGNDASMRVLAKAGFRREVTFPNPSDRHHGASTVLFALERSTASRA